jgi:hypothetical protein
LLPSIGLGHCLPPPRRLQVSLGSCWCSREIIGDRPGFQFVLSADGTWEVSAATQTCGATIQKSDPHIKENRGLSPDFMQAVLEAPQRVWN